MFPLDKWTVVRYNMYLDTCPYREYTIEWCAGQTPEFALVTQNNEVEDI